MHEHSSFVTLTYDQNVGPTGTLVPLHYQRWLKRLREMYSGKKLRYVVVGEYGEQFGAPHYHVALFGHPSCPFYSPVGRRKQCDCEVCKPIFDTWGHGRVSVDPLEFGSAQYIAGYVVKRMTKGALKFDKDDRVRSFLKGRYPEFMQPSRRPGIGAFAMEILAQRIEEYGDFVLNDGDVPLVLKHGQRRMPLGRYLRQKLREVSGLEAQKEVSLQKYLASVRETEMLAMLEAYEEGGAKAYKKVLDRRKAENLQAVLNIESKHKIFNSGKGTL